MHLTLSRRSDMQGSWARPPPHNNVGSVAAIIPQEALKIGSVEPEKCCFVCMLWDTQFLGFDGCAKIHEVLTFHSQLGEASFRRDDRPEHWTFYCLGNTCSTIIENERIVIRDWMLLQLTCRTLFFDWVERSRPVFVLEREQLRVYAQ